MQVHYLRDLGSRVFLTSYLEADMLETVMKYHKNWLDFPVVSFKDPTDIEGFLRKQANYSQVMVIDGNIEVLDPLTRLFPGFIYLLIKNANFKAKNSFDEIKNPLILPFLGFEDIDFPRIFDGFVLIECLLCLTVILLRFLRLHGSREVPQGVHLRFLQEADQQGTAMLGQRDAA